MLLRWGLQHGNIILPKSLTKHRIESNAQLFDFQLDNDDMDALGKLLAIISASVAENVHNDSCLEHFG